MQIQYPAFLPEFGFILLEPFLLLPAFFLQLLINRKELKEKKFCLEVSQEQRYHRYSI